MKRISLVLVLVVLMGAEAWACESYEECLKESNDVVQVNSLIATPTQDYRSYSVLKAIAFKLDEISETLNRAEINIDDANVIPPCPEGADKKMTGCVHTSPDESWQI